MVRSSLAALATFVALAVFAAGCGGGDGTGSGSTSAGATGGESTVPTKAEFIERADDICTNANAVEAAGITTLERANGFEPGTGEPSQAEQVRFVIMPAIRTEVLELAQLEPPKGEENQVNAIVSAYQEAVKEPISKLLHNPSNRFEKAYLLAQAYGLKVCGTA